MRKIICASLIAFAVATTAAPALSAELKVGANETVESLLKAQTGNRVVVRLRSGQELTGTVRIVGSRVVHLGALAGREFFDAVVPLESVEAVMIRTKQ